VLLGVSGGIAAYKSAFLARALMLAGAEVTAVLTESATRFVGPDTFSALTGRRAYSSLWEDPGAVLHVDLAHGNDIAVVAPATANLIAKLANGLSDDLLSATMLEFDGPSVIAPAMHTGMWVNPATQRNVRFLMEHGATIIGPVEGSLAHGDSGMGRMAEPEDIAVAVSGLVRPRDLEGRAMVVTAGPTHEPIDPVRFVGNRSSGKMGIALAREATSRGASVTLVLGPGTVLAPPGMDVVAVQTAEEMLEATLQAFAGADAVIMAAAVADFRPKSAADAKIKKEVGTPELVFEPTPDILSELATRRSGGQVLVGFAAETQDVLEEGRKKLQRKDLDVLVANQVGADGTGFGADTNRAAILGRRGELAPMRLWSKAELARAVCDEVVTLLGDR
jgi:phosphopantothenoylcysteine decarboxylase/phosphopantothenate--cysteine ligase